MVSFDTFLADRIGLRDDVLELRYLPLPGMDFEPRTSFDGNAARLTRVVAAA